MNLELIQTGNLHPTCGADYVHAAIVWHIFGQDVRVICRPNQPLDRILAFVQTDIAKALGYKDPAHAARSIGLTDDDQGMELLSTPGGPQKMKVLTFKGLTKFLMRSNHEKAVEFQDVLASKSSDLTFYGIAFADGSAPEVLASQLSANITAKMAELDAKVDAKLSSWESKFLETLEAIAPALRSTTLKPISINGRTPAVWSMRIHRSERANGYDLVSGILALKLNRMPTLAESSSLASRTKAYCRTHGLEIRYYSRHGKLRVYYPTAALEIVHRTGWRVKTAILCEAMSDAQDSLFGIPPADGTPLSGGAL